MDIRPILSSLRRSPTGAVLVALPVVAGPTLDFDFRPAVLPPCRVLDPRTAAAKLGGPALAADDVRVLRVTATCEIPADAISVAANITVTQPSAGGGVRLFAGATAPPLHHAVLFGPGQTRANNAILGLGNGSISIQNDSPGSVHVVLDVNGYFR